MSNLLALGSGKKLGCWGEKNERPKKLKIKN